MGTGKQLAPFVVLTVLSGVLCQPLLSRAADGISDPIPATEAPLKTNSAPLHQHTLPDSPDWGGIARDTAYFTGWQFVAVGMLYQAPESVTSWSEDDKSKITTTKWSRNVSNPVWDQDDWYLNYLFHPYWGATYYTRARERGLNRTDSFLTSALWSSIFEYGAEALFEPVSKQDLIVTPVAGALIGEYWFAPLREKILAQPGEPAGWNKTLLILTDPFYYLDAWAAGVFGVKTNASIRFTGTAMRDPNATTNGVSQSRSMSKALTLNLQFKW